MEARNMKRFQNGFSLVELMVGLTIGLLMLVALAGLLANNTSARVELDKTMQQVENGRFAMDTLVNDLRLTGFYGAGSPSATLPVAMPDPCVTTAAALTAQSPLPVQGYSTPGANPLACVAGNNIQPNSDILVVRRAETGATTVATAVAGQVYLQTNGTSLKIEGATSDAAANATLFDLTDKSGTAPLHPYTVHIYFVSPCDVPASGSTCGAAGTDDSGKSIPTLKRLELVLNAGAWGWKVVPLVQGVERLHVEYGVDSDNDGAPDSYFGTKAAIDAMTTTQWSNVVALNVSLLTRNTRPTPGYKDDKAYSLGTQGNAVAIPAANDEYKRHAYSGTIRLTNVSGRREG